MKSKKPVNRSSACSRQPIDKRQACQIQTFISFQFLNVSGLIRGICAGIPLLTRRSAGVEAVKILSVWLCFNNELRVPSSDRRLGLWADVGVMSGRYCISCIYISATLCPGGSRLPLIGGASEVRSCPAGHAHSASRSSAPVRPLSNRLRSSSCFKLYCILLYELDVYPSNYFLDQSVNLMTA